MPEYYPPPGSKRFHVKAEQYRARAEELSAISAQFHKGTARATLENLAEEYLRMAQQMDDLSGIKRRLRQG